MKWHIVCRIGEEDTFLPEVEEAVERCLVLHFSGGATNERIRESVIATIEERYEATLSGSVQDFLYASMGAYIADLCIPRRTAEDRWSRVLTLHLPVFVQSRWRSASRSFAAALEFLTGDDWTISVRERCGDRPEPSAPTDSELPRTVSLLSGGLDSLVGAIDLLSTGDAIAFVSHHGGGLTPKFQNDTFGALRVRYGDQCCENQFYVVGPQLGGDGENSMRSRSILFLGLGVAVANALGKSVPVVVPENGLISLNIPLTRTRSGSSSTRTTHPHFIARLRQTLIDLGLSNAIEMPYRHLTKGEMLANAADHDALESMLPLTMSCSHPEVARWKGGTPGMHCGYCFPCLIRRAAVTAAGLEEADAPYTFDVRHRAPTGTRASDLRAVKIALARDEESGSPNSFRVLEAGPLPSDEILEFVGVYERGMSELVAFLGWKR
ncbi:MAG: hypothetical protein IIA55_15310 [Gemmatimonadetes bacterium]|nr:hypothetical protein [Gemmatimonadota bacterium]